MRPRKFPHLRYFSVALKMLELRQEFPSALNQSTRTKDQITRIEISYKTTEHDKGFLVFFFIRLTNASISRSSSAKNRRIGGSWTDTDPNHGTSKAGLYLCVEENSIKAAHKNDLRAHAAFPEYLYFEQSLAHMSPLTASSFLHSARSHFTVN